jgi:hypothetical protein
MLSVPIRWSRVGLLTSLVLAAGLFLGIAATESAAQSTPTGFSSFFRVSGRISHPKTYRLADLKALPVHTVNVSFQGPGGIQTHQFTGALLEDVATAAAPRFDADRKNDFLRPCADQVELIDRRQALRRARITCGTRVWSWASGVQHEEPSFEWAMYARQNYIVNWPPVASACGDPARTGPLNSPPRQGARGGPRPRAGTSRPGRC